MTVKKKTYGQWTYLILSVAALPKICIFFTKIYQFENDEFLESIIKSLLAEISLININKSILYENILWYISN